MKLSLRTLVLYSIVLLLTACEGKKITVRSSKIRFINASANSGDINVYMDSKKMFATDIQYLNYSLFSEHISTTHLLQIKSASGSLIKETSLNLLYNETYTCVLYDSAGAVRLKVYTEDFRVPTGSSCKMRFLHLSNNAPATDITDGSDTTVIFRNYRNGDQSDYILYGLDSVKFNAHYTGDTIPYNSQRVKFQPKAGNFYTVYLSGNIGSTAVDSIRISVIENNGNY